jgi:YebC/PmpR family DNA-binding regulatory protein
MKARARPRVGVTGPNRGGTAAWWFTRLALFRAGAHAVRITPARRGEREGLDALVIGGGADVTEPLDTLTTAALPPRENVRWPRRVLDLLLGPLVLLLRLFLAARGHGADRARDALEVSLLEHAKQRDLPVLGICRGAQLMNVVEGGTLERNIATTYVERPELYTVLPRREVNVASQSRLSAIVGRPNLLVNSMHFHAVKEPGPGFAVVAREPSGVPQAIEHATRNFWLGVQWHPEYLPQQKPHQQIFRALCRAARSYAARERGHWANGGGALKPTSMGAQWKAKGRAAAADAKGRLFTKLAKEIIIAAKAGPDPAMNPRLRLAVEAARKASMTRDTLERAIKKGAGLLEGAAVYETVVYEGFAPHQVPVIVECLTDNKNRTAPNMRLHFRKGQLGASGSVSWDFLRQGAIEATPPTPPEDPEEAAIEAGAQAVEPLEDGGSRFLTEPAELDVVGKALGARGWTLSSQDLVWVAKNPVALDDEKRAEVEAFLAAIDDDDDVRTVFAGLA